MGNAATHRREEERIERANVVRAATEAAAERLRAAAAFRGPPPPRPRATALPAPPPAAPPPAASPSGAPPSGAVVAAARGGGGPGALELAARQLERGGRELTKADLVAVLARLHGAPLDDGAALAVYHALTVPELRARIRISVYGALAA